MFIPGYVGTGKSEEVMAEYRDRYKEIHHLAELLKIKKRPDYAHTHFSGELTTPETLALSELDLALIADHGNLCFGGSCTKDGNKFFGSYNTD